MNTTSKAHFSRMCGVSGAAITKAHQNGLIALTDKGSVNLDHRATKQYLIEKQSKAKGEGLSVAAPPRKPIPPSVEPPPPPPPVKATKPKKSRKLKLKRAAQPRKPKPIPPSEEEILEPEDIPIHKEPPPIRSFRTLADLSEADLTAMSKKDVDKLKTIEQTLKTRLDREFSEGLLVRREYVKQVFAQIYSVDTNELNTLKDRLTPAICGVFGEADDSANANKVRKMLDDEIIKSLRHIKRLINQFLVKVKEEPI